MFLRARASPESPDRPQRAMEPAKRARMETVFDLVLANMEKGVRTNVIRAMEEIETVHSAIKCKGYRARLRNIGRDLQDFPEETHEKFERADERYRACIDELKRHKRHLAPPPAPWRFESP